MEAKEFIQSLVDKARVAQREFEKFNQEQVDACVKALGKAIFDNAEPLAKLAHEETRMGVYEHKIAKNKGKARIIWNSLKDKKSVGVVEYDPAKKLTVFARPVGVVGAITPTTNPIVTPMCNAMYALKGRNAIIICPHPRAKKCSMAVRDLFNKALKETGAPENIVQFVEDPTVEMSGLVMSLSDICVATGGMGMVKAAYSSGKPALGVGAGNVQCIIDRGVDYKEAVPKIITGRAFDNGIICAGEQTTIIPEELFEDVLEEFRKNDALVVTDPAQKQALRDTIFPGGVMNKDMVGQDPQVILKAAGIPVPEKLSIIVVVADGIGKEDLFCKEKMCPVNAVFKYKTFEDAVAIAQANLDLEGKGHTVSLHSNNRDHMIYAGEQLTVSRIVVNQVCSTNAGGSFQNGLNPTTTLGCSTWGNNSMSENIYYKHFINYIRVAECIDTPAPTDEEIWG